MVFVPATTGLLCILLATQSTYKFSQHRYLFTIQGRRYAFFFPMLMEMGLIHCSLTQWSKYLAAFPKNSG